VKDGAWSFVPVSRSNYRVARAFTTFGGDCVCDANRNLNASASLRLATLPPRTEEQWKLVQ